MPIHLLRNVAALVVAGVLLGVSPGTAAATAQPVKLSGSGICHCPSGQYYEGTTAFTPFTNIDACLAAGGRHPKRGQGNCVAGNPAEGTGQSAAITPAPPAVSTGAVGYDRARFGDWIDEDGDCQNTRHELLAELSTGPVHYSSDGCRVTHGRWNDPYSGKIFSDARQLDVDHLVPLAYAWSRGADRWSDADRRRFANDPVNLFAVEASLNRQKGARGPTEWMPPNPDFRCQYVLRFTRVVLQYRLTLPAEERAAIERMRAETCG